MMRGLAMMAAAGMLGAVTVGAPAVAQVQQMPQAQVQAYEYDGRTYETRQQCLAAKKRAKTRGTIAGAAVAGLGAALLGGNVGETALVAGGGAVVGNVIAGKTKQC